MTTVKPRAGERVYDYLVRVARERLLRAGCAPQEADGWAETAVLDIGTRERLESWRVDDARDWAAIERGVALSQAQITREQREKRRAAGYMAPHSPIYAHGVFYREEGGFID